MSKNDAASAAYVDEDKLTIRQLKEQIGTFHSSIFARHLAPEGGIEGVLVRGGPGLGKSQMVDQLGKELAAEIGGKFIKYTPKLFEKMNTDIPKVLSKCRPGEIEAWMLGNQDHLTRIRKTLDDLQPSELQQWREKNGDFLTGFGKPVKSLSDTEFEHFVASNANMIVPKRKKVGELTDDEREIFIKKEGRQIQTDNMVTLDALDPVARRKFLEDNKYFIVGSMSVAKVYGSSVQGVPTLRIAENGEKVMDFAVPDFFKTISEFPNAIVHLDEVYQIIGAEALLSLATEGYYGQTELPKRCMLLATGNLGKEDFTTRGEAFGAAFNSRFTHYEVKTDIAEWNQDFAIPRGLHPAVRRFASDKHMVFETTQMAHLKAMQSSDPNKVLSPNVRSLAVISQNLYGVEEKFFSKMGEKTSMSSLSAADRLKFKEGMIRSVKGRLGMPELAGNFWEFYETAMTTVIPEVYRVLSNKPTDPPSKEFMEKVGGLSSAKDAISVQMAYTDYLPRMTLDIYSALAKKHKEPELRVVREALISNMLQGLLPCHQDMRALAISTFTMYVKHKSLVDPEVNKSTADIFAILTARQKTHPEFANMINEFKEAETLGQAFSS